METQVKADPRGIWSISLEGSDFEEFDTEEDSHKELSGLGALNLFVGANNSGKSRLMRGLVRHRDWQGDVRRDGLQTTIESILNQFSLVAQAVQERPFSSPESRTAWHAIRDYIKRRDASQKWFSLTNRILLDTLRKLAEDMRIALAEPYLASWYPKESTKLRAAQTQLCKALSDIAPALECVGRRTYIPVLRGLRALKDTDYTDFHAAQTSAAYQITPAQCETGLNIFDRLSRLNNGDQAARNQKRDYEAFLTKHFFEGRRVELTPHYDMKLRIAIGGVEHVIHDKGDGLQMIILLTFKPFMEMLEERPSIFFIEEPELFLHPGMQRRLLQFYVEKTPHLYFATTHSNHMLDMTLDWDQLAVYNFWKQPTSDTEGERFRVRGVDRGDQSSLRLLGVRASSVFLVNATLWVEGNTDRLYLRQLLGMLEEALGKAASPKMEEDIHFSFVEYGGALLTHWSFLDQEPHPMEVERLCGNAMLLTDRDDGEVKRARQRRLTEKLGDRFVMTEGREIENMLPAKVIRAVVASYEGSESHIPHIQRQEYQDKKLGEWLDDILPEGTRKRRGAYTSRGTLSDKVEFCDRAVQHLRQCMLSDLDLEVRQLLLKMYNHFRTQNGLEVVGLPAE